ncbi:MAG: DUF697 domain-containing protein [Candidatus Cloacimonetes bacterium]|nr:DUF697 domain-containing protein [Candidatus Cloacimonadota bacterium]
MDNHNFSVQGGPVENNESTPPSFETKQEEMPTQELSIVGGPVSKDELKTFFKDFEHTIKVDTQYNSAPVAYKHNKLFLISLISFVILVFLNFSIEFAQYSFQLSPINGYASVAILTCLALGLFQWIYKDLRSISRLKTSYKLRVEASELYSKLSEGALIPLSDVKNYFDKLSSNWTSQSEYSQRRLKDLNLEIEHRIKNKIEVEPIIYLKQLDEEILFEIDKKVKSTIHKKVLRCAISTGISNIALVDATFFILIYLSMVKEVCQHYGYRPGPIGTLWILRNVGTGALLASSSQTLLNLAPEAFSQEFAAKLGQGSLMGLWMLKSGYHLMEICRPFPKNLNQQNSYTQEFIELFISSKK